MKTKYLNYTRRYFYLFWGAVLLVSCEGFTDVDLPQTQLTQPSVFNDPSTAEAALASAYASLRENGVAAGNTFSAPSLLANYSDDLDYYGSDIELEQFNRHNVIASNSLLYSLWNTSYNTLYQVNAIIEGMEASTSMSGERRDGILGEAYFLRAFVHSYLTGIFGDIPYVSGTDYRANSTITRTLQTQVWDNIKADLTRAEALLPAGYASQERVRVNKAAARALMARTCLYTGAYQLAEQYATLVLEDAQYALVGDLDSVFLKDSPGIIWALHPGLTGLNTQDAATYIITETPPLRPALSQGLYNSFESGDQRREHWTKSITDGSQAWHYAFKYKVPYYSDSSQEYTVVLRIEEQYLIRAEARLAQSNLGGAKEDLNTIRHRAGLADTPAGTTSGLLEAILAERRHEFFTEQGHRWLDLKRTGTASEILAPIKPGWQPTDILFPIPEKEMLLNPNLLPQNPGY